MDNDLHRQQLGKGTTGSDFDLALNQTGWGRDLHFKTNNFAFFAQNNFIITEKLVVSPGLRIEAGQSTMSGNINSYDYEPGEIANTIKHHFPLFGIQSQYTLNENHNFYAGWSQCYRPVVFKDIIPGSIYERTDKNLKDAYGSNIEAGYRGSMKSFHWDLGVFQMRYNNRPGTLNQPDNIIYRTNIGNSVTRGMEFFAEHFFHLRAATLSLFTSTSLFDAKYKNAHVRSGTENKDVSGNSVESVPNVITRNGFRIKYHFASFSILYSYTGNSYADALNTKTPTPKTGAVGLVPAYGILDINSSFKIYNSITLRVNINNVTNKQYFTKRPQFYPGPGVWSSDGRSFNISLGVKI
jgi:Fe(3+) dicitrate transport protein